MRFLLIMVLISAAYSKTPVVTAYGGYNTSSYSFDDVGVNYDLNHDYQLGIQFNIALGNSNFVLSPFLEFNYGKWNAANERTVTESYDACEFFCSSVDAEDFDVTVKKEGTHKSFAIGFRASHRFSLNKKMILAPFVGIGLITGGVDHKRNGKHSDMGLSDFLDVNDDERREAIRSSEFDAKREIYGWRVELGSDFHLNRHFGVRLFGMVSRITLGGLLTPTPLDDTDEVYANSERKDTSFGYGGGLSVLFSF